MKKELAPSGAAVPSAAQSADKPAPAPQTPAGKKKKKGADPLVRFLVKLVVVGSIAAAALIFVFGIHIYHGNAMHPFIMDGDLLITYKLGEYHIGDAVVYRHPVTGEKSVSRIVALGGSEVMISENGELLVNGSIPSESVFYATAPLSGSSIVYPYQVASGQVFLLDDFRTQGMDSRAFGAVAEENLLGKVSYVIRRRGI